MNSFLFPFARFKQLVLFATLIFVSFCSQSYAASDISAEQSSEVVGIGEGFRVTLSALGDEDESFSDPKLKSQGSPTIHGPQLGSKSFTSFGFGSAKMMSGVTASWTLIFPKTGNFDITLSILVNGQQKNAGTLHVQVVEEPQQRQASRHSPFGSMFPFGFPGGADPSPQQPRRPQIPELPKELHPKGKIRPDGFVRVSVARTQIYLGEAISLKALAFGSHGNFQCTLDGRLEIEGWLAYDQSIDPRKELYLYENDGKRFIVHTLWKRTLVPTQVGKLTLPLGKYMFEGGNYQLTTGGTYSDEPADLVFEVITPPEKDRPSDYELGVVGEYTLKKELSQTQLAVGQELILTLTIEGSGRAPRSLILPELKGFELSEPTISETEKVAQDHGIETVRRFEYLIKAEKAGTFDLGEISFSYFNPRSRSYQQATASLGKLRVIEATTPVKAPPEEPSEKSTEAKDSSVGFQPPPPVTKRRAQSISSNTWLLPFDIWPLGLLIPCALWLFLKIQRFRGRPTKIQKRKSFDIDFSEFSRLKATGESKAASLNLKSLLDESLIELGLSQKSSTESSLRARGASTQLLEKLRSIKSRIDANCYSDKATYDLDELEASARSIISELSQLTSTLNGQRISNP